ncbi:hypothetical protein BDW71DRAFT_9529 [Aspergillus fruticulosus]
MKRSFLIFFSVNFTAASALCGGAPNIPAEIVGRTWAGAGGNGIYCGLLKLASSNYAGERPVDLYQSHLRSVSGIDFIYGLIPTQGWSGA